jgi:hypothetical protein
LPCLRRASACHARLKRDPNAMKHLVVFMFLALSIAGIGLAATAAADVATIYVSPTGNDQDSGTEAKPLRTLEAARDAIRTMRAQSGLPKGGVTVYLRGGIYERAASFSLSKQDSGAADSPITYASAPGEVATCTGGRVLKPEWFTKVTDPAVLARLIDKKAHTRILQIDLAKHGIDKFGEIHRRGFGTTKWAGKVPPLELYLDGERMHLARWPNKGQGVMHMSGVKDAGPKSNSPDPSKRGGTFSYAFSRPEFWKHEKDLWIDGVVSQDWAWTYNKIASIDTKAKTITLQYGEVYGIMVMPPKVKTPYPELKKQAKTGPKPKGKPRDFFYVDNVFAELDAPGEYYLDRDTGILYVIPPKPLAACRSITVSMLETPMIEMKETSSIVFEDLILEGGRGSAVACTDGSANRFAFCEIRNFGGDGLAIQGRENQVVSCLVHHIGGNAIALDGGDFETLTPANNSVENCHLYEWGVRQKVYTSAVGFSGVGNRMSHCHAHSAPHMAVQVGGNDHVIEYNEFDDVSRDFHDMGVIYMNLGAKPLCRGQQVRRNFFHHIGLAGGVNGVYPDNGTMGVLVEENVFYKFGPGEFSYTRAIGGNGFDYVIVRNNMFIDCEIVYDQSYYLTTPSNRKKFLTTFEKEWKDLAAKYDVASMPHGTKYPELLRFPKETRIFPEGNVFEGNLVYNPTVACVHDGVLMTRGGPTKHIKTDNNWLADKNPGFVNLAKMDFRLKSDAEVLKRIKGFKPIPFEEIGLRGPVGPKGANK